MSLQIYKTLHMLGFGCVFLALGGMASFALQGAQGPPAAEGQEAPARPKVWAILHGVGLVLLLVAGFGALAKLGIKAPPAWAWGKLVLWLALGALPVVFKRAPKATLPTLLAIPGVALLAALLANYHPGG